MAQSRSVHDFGFASLRLCEEMLFTPRLAERRRSTLNNV
jgi:hypothetical protein